MTPPPPNRLEGFCPCGALVLVGDGFWRNKLKQVWCAPCYAQDEERISKLQNAKPAAPETEERRGLIRIFFAPKQNVAFARTWDLTSTNFETFNEACKSIGCANSHELGWHCPIGVVPSLVDMLQACRLKVELSDSAADALLTAADASKKAAAATDVRALVTSRKGRKLKEYQKIGAEFMASRTISLNADDGGCLAGDTLIHISRGGLTRRIPISELYEKFNGISGAWNTDTPTLVKSLTDNGYFKLHPIKAVISSGTKSTVEITLASGKRLVLTPDHEVCTSTKPSFTRADALSKGDKVLTNGTAMCLRTGCGSTENICTYRQAKFRGYCRKCIYRICRKNHVKNGFIITKDGYKEVTGMRFHPTMERKVSRSESAVPCHSVKGVLEHRLVVEAEMNDMPLKQWLEVCRTNAFTQKHVFLDDALIVHHKNHDRLDNRLDNLEVMTDTQHRIEHGQDGGFLRLNGAIGGRGGRVLFIPVEDTVVSVTPRGQTETYDIACEDPWRNFVANGVVVHNCGKSAQALAACPSSPRLLIVAPTGMKGAVLNGKPIGGWADEIALWRPDIKKISILSGRDSFRWPEENEAVILNYKILPPTPDEIAKKWRLAQQRKKRGEKPPHVGKQAPTPPRGVTFIIDEAHELGNPGSQQTKRVAHLRREIIAMGGMVMALTATPLKNDNEELFSVLDAIGAAPLVFAGKDQFRMLHGGTWEECGRGRKRWVWAKEASPEVAERLRRVMIRRRKRDVLHELPPITIRRVVVDVDRETLEACNAVVKEIEAAGISIEEALEKADEARAGYSIQTMSAALEALSRLKTPFAIELATEYERRETPCLVFGAHVAVVDAFIGRPGWGTIQGDGATICKKAGAAKKVKRTEVVRDFQSGAVEYGVAATIGSSGVGITLTRASEVILASKVWSPLMNAQAIWRADRIGQKNPVTVVEVLANHPLDVHMSEVLERKLALYASTIDAAAVAPEDIGKRIDLSGKMVETASLRVSRAPRGSGKQR
jgi:hypothetical protein